MRRERNTEREGRKSPSKSSPSTQRTTPRPEASTATRIPYTLEELEGALRDRLAHLRSERERLAAELRNVDDALARIASRAAQFPRSLAEVLENSVVFDLNEGEIEMPSRRAHPPLASSRPETSRIEAREIPTDRMISRSEPVPPRAPVASPAPNPVAMSAPVRPESVPLVAAPAALPAQSPRPAGPTVPSVSAIPTESPSPLTAPAPPAVPVSPVSRERRGPSVGALLLEAIAATHPQPRNAKDLVDAIAPRASTPPTEIAVVQSLRALRSNGFLRTDDGESYGLTPAGCARVGIA